MRNFLRYCSYLLGKESDRPEPAQPLPKAGLWQPTPKAFHGKTDKRKIVALCFYRALLQSGQLQPVEAIVTALEKRDMIVLPIFVSSLKDGESSAVILALLERYKPDIILNATGFSASSGAGKNRVASVLEKCGNMVLQVIFSSSSLTSWQQAQKGLTASDLAMNVALPEIDGRIFSRAVSFKSAQYFDEATQCNIVTHQPIADRVEFVGELTARWLRLKNKKPVERRIALVMARYPGGGGLAHGVGLDTPASCITILNAMAAQGYRVANYPQSPTTLMQQLAAGPTTVGAKNYAIRVALSLNDYNKYFRRLPQQAQESIMTRWGKVENDPFFDHDQLALPVMMFDEIVVGIQPQRSFGDDITQSYHALDLAPCHHYMAFYFWLRHNYHADAIVHIGKHGNLEWLPGKAMALSENCFPELALGPTPHIYPFIVNDPGEGTQAKRRSSAVIIDHLTPPLTRAESYGQLKDLEVLVDEYYEASGLDPRRLKKLKGEILNLVALSGLNHDVGIEPKEDDEKALQKLDAFLCDLKELQIRDGLHIFGKSPRGKQLVDLLVALARVPRGRGEKDSLHRAIATDLGLINFDPLNCALSAPWQQKRPNQLAQVSTDLWRTQGDTVERIEIFASMLIAKEVDCPPTFIKTKEILDDIENELRPLVQCCGQRELAALMQALNGKFVEPGPSGAPTRGRADVLPTGRNFYSLDSRAVPTFTAWELGQKSAELLVVQYVQDHGTWPTSFALTLWGTANMRTGGDDIAQALALIGVQPVWDASSRRLTGYEIIPSAKMQRPRVDVTLRISGFFRDSFPEQLQLFDQAIRAVGELDEEVHLNPIAERMSKERALLVAEGWAVNEAKKAAGFRIFGSEPGAFGTGVQELLDSGRWEQTADFADVWLHHSSYAYGQDEGIEAHAQLLERLRTVDAVVQNQDNREHDVLDSAEYYAFEGGMAAAVKSLKGQWPVVYHNDLSRAERPVIQTLQRELGRIVRGRAANPKWIKGVMRHGYKGAAEIAATVHYLFAFAATTNFVSNAHFDALYDAYIADDAVRDFFARVNPAAWQEIVTTLSRAIERHLWVPRLNSVNLYLQVEIKDGRRNGCKDSNDG